MRLTNELEAVLNVKTYVLIHVRISETVQTLSIQRLFSPGYSLSLTHKMRLVLVKIGLIISGEIANKLQRKKFSGKSTASPTETNKEIENKIPPPPKTLS